MSSASASDLEQNDTESELLSISVDHHMALSSVKFELGSPSVGDTSSLHGDDDFVPLARRGSSSSGRRLTPVRAAPVPVNVLEMSYTPDPSLSPADAATEYFDLIRLGSASCLGRESVEELIQPRSFSTGRALSRVASSDSFLPERSHEDEQWYYGKMSDQGCSRLLLEKGRENDFLIRRRDDTLGGLTLSINIGNTVCVPFFACFFWLPLTWHSVDS